MPEHPSAKSHAKLDAARILNWDEVSRSRYKVASPSTSINILYCTWFGFACLAALALLVHACDNVPVVSRDIIIIIIIWPPSLSMHSTVVKFQV